MRPYFVLSRLGRELKAAGKRVRQEPPFGTWYLRYRDAFGTKQREACPEARTEADAIRKNLEKEEEARDRREGRNLRRALSRMKWEALRDAYLEAHAHLSSQAPMRSQFKRWFDEEWASRFIASITTHDCEKLLTRARTAGQAPATVRQLHIRGRTVFQYAVERLQELEANPWAKVPRPPVPQRRPLFLRREQVQALLVAAGPHRLLLLMAVLTGLRRGELAGLKWTDIDFAAGKGGVVHARRSWDRETTKGRKERVVPIHPALREELLRAAKASASEYVFPAPRKGGMRNESWHVAKLLRSIAARAGVTLPEGFVFHGLRATFITHLYHATGDITAAQRLAGHSTPALTERVYAGVDLGHLESAVGAMDFTGGEQKTSTRPSVTAVQPAAPSKKG